MLIGAYFIVLILSINLKENNHNDWQEINFDSWISNWMIILWDISELNIFTDSYYTALYKSIHFIP